MAKLKTYSVYNFASRAFMHITATSKKHVKIYLREKGYDIYCSEDIQILHKGGEGASIEGNYPELF